MSSKTEGVWEAARTTRKKLICWAGVSDDTATRKTRAHAERTERKPDR